MKMPKKGRDLSYRSSMPDLGEDERKNDDEKPSYIQIRQTQCTIVNKISISTFRESFTKDLIKIQHQNESRD